MLLTSPELLPETELLAAVDAFLAGCLPEKEKRREERGEQREAATDFRGGLPALRRVLLLHRRRVEWGDAGVSPALAVAARFNELLARVVVVLRRCWTEQLLLLFSR
ncbi:hypothetical protein KY290_013038 [Solanum tuberosum]|uniref:Uncharacterized protein n=1 Tax=Solanum tuberosum TaxID=4113 RepID=A0ABQ7VKK9_SOLTU|nr:hypothetical protein KY285_012810 [Solanum tuberosum]KAH0769057.1 hypothetical protein KY290_013038 [Solanum tuberosum]